MIKAATIPMHMQMEGRSWVGEKKKKNEVLLKEQTMHEIDVSMLAKKKKKIKMKTQTYLHMAV